MLEKINLHKNAQPINKPIMPKKHSIAHTQPLRVNLLQANAKNNKIDFKA